MTELYICVVMVRVKTSLPLYPVLARLMYCLLHLQLNSEFCCGIQIVNHILFIPTLSNLSIYGHQIDIVLTTPLSNLIWWLRSRTLSVYLPRDKTKVNFKLWRPSSCRIQVQDHALFLETRCLTWFYCLRLILLHSSICISYICISYARHGLARRRRGL